MRYLHSTLLQWNLSKMNIQIFWIETGKGVCIDWLLGAYIDWVLIGYWVYSGLGVYTADTKQTGIMLKERGILMWNDLEYSRNCSGLFVTFA